MAHQNVRPRVLQFAHFTGLLALCLLGSSPLAAKGGGLAGIIAASRAPAYAQAATVHWLRWNDFVPASDELLKKEIAPEITGEMIQLDTIALISVQRTAGRVTVKEASKTLASMVTSLGARHVFLADDRRPTDFPEWCLHASRTTDAHLLQLAEAHGARLVTLDTGIPGAFLVPALAAKRHLSFHTLRDGDVFPQPLPSRDTISPCASSKSPPTENSSASSSTAKRS